jgi:hypothetical protein
VQTRHHDAGAAREIRPVFPERPVRRVVLVADRNLLDRCLSLGVLGALRAAAFPPLGGEYPSV